jgi:ElaA protein
VAGWPVVTTDAIPTPTAALVQRARGAELDPRTLYDLLRLRSDVFVVEQDCVFLDLDGRDLEPDAEHLWIADDGGVAAELRLLREIAGGGDDEWSIGRVVARSDVRSTGVASRLFLAGLDRLRELGCRSVTIGAQAYLVDWYGRFGFVRCGPRYLEDGILHVPMRRDLDPDDLP